MDLQNLEINKMKKSIYLAVLLLFAMPSMAQDAETELFYPAEYAVVEIGMLTAVGRQVYQNGMRLTPDEVRGLMAGIDAVVRYDNGLRRIQTGNNLLWTGAGAFVVCGVTGFLMGIVCCRYCVLPRMTAGLFFGTILAAYAVVPGLILRGVGRRDIRTAVDMHNQNVHTSNIEFNFGFTQNGIGVVVRF